MPQCSSTSSILAWHELARDRFGTRELTIVYGTLCGTVIPYDSVVDGTMRVFGTSGLLYRSNKLMFDATTKSLWSSLEGMPVIGPLVGSGLRLSILPVVTTTWGEWKRVHPDTTVLSLDTGFTRDYSEGAAYRQYFATDALMFRGRDRIDSAEPKAATVSSTVRAVYGLRMRTSSETRSTPIFDCRECRRIGPSGSAGMRSTPRRC